MILASAMSSTEAPEAGRTKRPRFLVVALALALVFGAGCWTDGCNRLAFYRGDREQKVTSAIQNDDDRARAEALFQRYVDAADNARGRTIPLAAATFVLGAALLALGARGLAGRSNTRSALMQVVTAQAVVVAATYYLTRDVWSTEADWQYETTIMLQHQRSPAEQYEQMAETVRSVRRWAPPAWLAVRSFASLLIVIALSRPRSRAFFDAAGGAVSE